MWLFIEPLDVLLFRESKPFSAGESFWARSTFPPSPLPFLGAIRSKILVERQVDFRTYKRAAEAIAKGRAVDDAELQELIQEIGGPCDYGQIQATGPFLCARERDTVLPYFPVSFDLLLQDGKAKAFSPCQFPWSISQTPPALLSLWAAGAGEIAEGMLVDARNLKQYLNGEGNWVPERTSKLWDKELRVGIELGSGRTAEEGKLYTIEFTRMKGTPRTPVGFLMAVSGLDNAGLSRSGFLTLGGESRAADYEVLEEAALLQEFKQVMQGNDLKKAFQGKPSFKLYLATPAIFEQGWLPDFLKDSGGEYRGQVGSLQFKLVAAAVGKAVPIGGWDLAHNRPRPMRKAVPAGSVYFFEKADGQLGDQEIETLFQAFHFKSLLRKSWEGVDMSQQPQFSQDGQAGFGLALLGTWPKEGAHV